MAGELHFLDEVVRWGDPWHGLLRGGVLELPNETTMARPAFANDGHVFEIRVPGTPEVTLTEPELAADTTAGRTWLNYALMTGRNHVLYGQALGDLSWVLVDAANKAWKATMAWDSLGVGSVSIARLFSTGFAQTISSVAAGPAITTAASAQPGIIMDVAPNGRKVIFSFAPVATPESPLALAVLEISGSVPACTGTLSLVFEAGNPSLENLITSDDRVTTVTHRIEIREIGSSPSVFDYVEQTYSLADGAPPYTPPSGWEFVRVQELSRYTSGTFVRKDLKGKAFKADGTLVDIRYNNETIDTAKGWDQAWEAPEKNYTGSYTVRQWLTVGTVTGASVSQSYQFTGSSIAVQLTGGQEAWLWRYTNRLYGLTEVVGAVTKYHPPVSTVSQATGTPFENARPWATFHPVTNAIVWHADALGVVCWV